MGSTLLLHAKAFALAHNMMIDVLSPVLCDTTRTPQSRVYTFNLDSAHEESERCMDAPKGARKRTVLLHANSCTPHHTDVHDACRQHRLVAKQTMVGGEAHEVCTEALVGEDEGPACMRVRDGR